MKYDDASWHYGAENFPQDLPEEAGATHTGMFVAWAMLSGLAGSTHLKDFSDDIAQLVARMPSPAAFFIKYCDSKFTSDDLNEEGNRFAAAYFDLENGKYIDDYEAVLGEGGRSLYYVANTWGNFERLRALLDRRYQEWKAQSS